MFKTVKAHLNCGVDSGHGIQYVEYIVGWRKDDTNLNFVSLDCFFYTTVVNWASTHTIQTKQAHTVPWGIDRQPSAF